VRDGTIVSIIKPYEWRETMLEPVKATDELMAQIGALQQRIARLETERDQVRATAMSALPQTNLLSPKFLTRAFAVWGHYFVASLLIGIVVGVAYCLILTVFGGLAAVLGNLGH
jgi:hypothetical protein